MMLVKALAMRMMGDLSDGFGLSLGSEIGTMPRCCELGLDTL